PGAGRRAVAWRRKIRSGSSFSPAIRRYPRSPPETMGSCPTAGVRVYAPTTDRTERRIDPGWFRWRETVGDVCRPDACRTDAPADRAATLNLGVDHDHLADVLHRSAGRRFACSRPGSRVHRH